jgi:magnesium-transporting ATPase (P-type)
MSRIERRFDFPAGVTHYACASPPCFTNPKPPEWRPSSLLRERTSRGARARHALKDHTVVCFSLFTVFNSRSDERTVFRRLFVNSWLWGAVLLSAALQAAVIYVPFLQVAFGTMAISAGDWLLWIAVASSVLWVRELSKLIARTAGWA